MDSLGEIISLCLQVRSVCSSERIGQENLMVVVKLEDAQKAHADLQPALPDANSDKVLVPYIRHSKMAEFSQAETAMIQRPPAPEANKVWFRMAGLSIMVIE